MREVGKLRKSLITTELTFKTHRKLSGVEKMEAMRCSLEDLTGFETFRFLISPATNVLREMVALPPRCSTTAKAYAVGVTPSSNCKCRHISTHPQYLAQ
jgi:hypothetical protein